MVLNRVALTGSSGMVGRHVISALTLRNIECLASSRSRPESMPDSAVWRHWDLSDWKTEDELVELFPGADAVIHVGASVPRSSDPVSDRAIFDANVRSCLCLALWAQKMNIPMVFLSGAIVYANPERIGILETSAKTKGGLGGFYGYSKLLAEHVLSYEAKSGLHLCILRPSSIYGYGLPEEKMISVFLRKAAGNEMIDLVPPTDDAVNLIHAFDVAEALIRVLEKDVRGIYNIAGESNVSILEIAEKCVKVVGKGAIKTVRTFHPRKPVVRFSLSCAKARSKFSFAPQITIDHGLALMWSQLRRGELQTSSNLI